MPVLYDGFNNIININDIYTSVLSFGASGDGVTDDTAAIQAALDSLKDTGGTIYFPVGTYKLTASVYFYSNQYLLFEKGAKLLQGADINNLMMNYSTADIGGYDATENAVIDGAIFDGSNFTTDITMLGICHSKNITIKNCQFINCFGYWHQIEVNSSKNVLIDGCYFEGERKTASSGEMIQIDSFVNIYTWPWGNGASDNTISYMVEVKNCHFENSANVPAIGNHSSETAVNCIRIHDNIFEGLSSDRGVINFQSAKNVDVYNNTFVDCNTGVTIGTADGTNAVYNNRFIGINSVGSGINSFFNMINGSLKSTSGVVETSQLDELSSLLEGEVE